MKYIIDQQTYESVHHLYPWFWRDHVAEPYKESTCNKDSKRTNELLPCPFCGKEPMVHGDDLLGYAVHCLIVGCTVNPTSNSRKTEQEAIEAWNTRVGERQENQ